MSTCAASCMSLVSHRRTCSSSSLVGRRVPELVAARLGPLRRGRLARAHKGLATPAGALRRFDGGGVNCTALTRAGRRCQVPWQLVGGDGLCPVRACRVDAAAIGRAGGLASGVARREQARRVRERFEEARVQVAVDRALQRELEQRQRERREAFDRDLVARRARFVAAARKELREKLLKERAELRRLRRQRKKLETSRAAKP